MDRTDYYHGDVCMSADEIIVELSKLDPRDLEKVDAKLHQLLERGAGKTPAPSWGQALLEVAGSAEGLPEDLAHNHEHYLHGTPRR